MHKTRTKWQLLNFLNFQGGKKLPMARKAPREVIYCCKAFFLSFLFGQCGLYQWSSDTCYTVTVGRKACEKVPARTPSFERNPEVPKINRSPYSQAALFKVKLSNCVTRYWLLVKCPFRLVREVATSVGSHIQDLRCFPSELVEVTQCLVRFPESDPLV